MPASAASRLPTRTFALAAAVVPLALAAVADDVRTRKHPVQEARRCSVPMSGLLPPGVLDAQCEGRHLKSGVTGEQATVTTVPRSSQAAAERAPLCATASGSRQVRAEVSWTPSTVGLSASPARAPKAPPAAVIAGPVRPHTSTARLGPSLMGMGAPRRSTPAENLEEPRARPVGLRCRLASGAHRSVRYGFFPTALPGQDQRNFSPLPNHGLPATRRRLIVPRPPSRRGLSGHVCVPFDGLEPVFEPVAGSVDGDHVAVVEKAVEDGGGEDLVTEHLSPLAEGLVRGQEDRALFVPL
jgi:hypothetical protein